MDHIVKYVIIPTADNETGASLNVEVIADRTGLVTVTRAVEDGDLVGVPVEVDRMIVARLHHLAGYEEVETAEGDRIICTASAADVPFQAGLEAIVLRDGTVARPNAAFEAPVG